MSDSAIYSVRLRWRPHEDVTKIRKIDIQRTSGDLPTHKELLTGELGLRKVFQPLKNRCRTDVLKFTNNKEVSCKLEEAAYPGEYVLELEIVEIDKRTNLSSHCIYWNCELPVCGMEGHHQAVATDGSNETCNQQTWQPRVKHELKYDEKGYEDIPLTEHDPLVQIVSDCGRRSYRKIAIALKISSRDIDDLPQCTNEERLHRLLVGWIADKGKEATRRMLLMACKKANVFGAVEMELLKQDEHDL
ncbi:uncharacterized protein LOC134190625 isoform X2 [Corticium candelabrum]|uniref:uncharacterized protein LOC134190625 isoform X2 n=1 Tax=Corticium candelabrum TaxID=121492 RepID=UPI002E263F73|nr:uncharacterized protein LOC134190625 isoform X2 [Corticium candelabrum]